MITLPLAQQDIADNTDYISVKKKAPQTALKLLNGSRQTIEVLDYMPEQHELDEDDELASLGINAIIRFSFMLIRKNIKYLCYVFYICWWMQNHYY